MGRAPARSYDEYLKAYSVAMLPGRERENLSYGGKSTRHVSHFAGNHPVLTYSDSHHASVCSG